MSGAASRRRGHDAERAVARWLRDNGYPDAATTRSRLGHDGFAQPGDIEFTPGVSLEVKDVAVPRWGAWLQQTIDQAGPDRLAAVVRRLRGCPRVGEWTTWWNVEPGTDRWKTGTFADFLAWLEDER